MILQGGFRSLQRHGGSRDLWGDCQEGRERGGGQDDDGGDHDDHDGDGDDHDADGDDRDVLKLVESVPPVCQI